MTLSRLLLQNVKGLRSKYIGLLVSSAFSALIFYLFASFVMHPDVASGYIWHAEQVIPAMVVCEWMIVVFSFFFIWYSSTAFVKSRKKEFGLFTLLGASRKQLNKTLVLEHAVIGAASLGIGIGLGTLLFKLMLMVMSKMLMVESPIRFVIVPKAVLLTVCVYAGLFLIVSVFTMASIRSSQIIQLVRAAQKPKTLPRYSPWLVLLSVTCLLAAYGLAWITVGQTLVLFMLPCVALVSVGSYFLFTQSSVALFRRLQKSPSVYYRNTKLLTIADLVFKMKENAQVLAVVAILSATILTSIGSIYTASGLLLNQEEVANPQALTFAVKGYTSAEMSKTVRDSLASTGFAPQSEIALDGVQAVFDDNSKVLFIPESSYNAWATAHGKQAVDIQPGTAAKALPPGVDAGPSTPMSATVGTRKAALTRAEPVFLPETNPLSLVQALFVIDDGQARDLEAGLPEGSEVAFMSYDLEQWQQAYMAFSALKAQIPQARILGFTSRIDAYQGKRQMVSLTAFIAMFITALFFMAAGSMLYFRLFIELQEDQAKYSAMRKLGLSWREISQIITRQVLILFFAPFAVGAVHCLFAFKALSNVLQGNVWQYAGLSIAIFFAMQTLYFALTRKAYLSEIATMQ